MICKTIAFVDYNDVAKKEKYWFNLSKAEILRLDAYYEGGIQRAMKKALSENDTATMFGIFEKLILTSYGRKTVDGGFAKSEAATTAFSQTEAYSELLMEMATDESGKKFGDFFKGVLPRDYASRLPEDVTTLVPGNED